MSPLPSRDRNETEHGSSPLAALAPEVRTGTELAGYRIGELVGRGGMGVVYRAEQLRLERTVALKLLVPELSNADGFRERFIREARTAAAIQHPNIVTVYDAGEADGLLYIAMQLIEGTDLATTLSRAGALEPPRALEILGQVADALDAAHALGIVHRDVKPGNVLLDSARAYLTDFGLTRTMSAQTALTMQGQFVGTIDYVPPEQIKGGPLDARTDVYALGCVLYHCLTGAAPFVKDSQLSVIYAHLEEEPPSLVALRPGLTRDLDAVMAKAMAKGQDERYGTCAELIAAARAALGEDAASPSTGAAPAPLVPALKILIADRDAAVRAMIRVTLNAGRFEVLEADDGRKALELVRRELPALVFVDWGLTEVSGPELCQALRADARTAPAKVVVLAGRAEALDDRAARAAGADEYIAKPFSSLQLLYRVGDLLDQELVSG